MKKFVLIIFTFIFFANCKAEDLENIVRYYSKIRPASALKSIMSGILAYYSFKHAWDHLDQGYNELTNTRKKFSKHFILSELRHCAITGGLGYTGYKLAMYCWHNAKHALAIK
jgi:hypothetical protein